MGKRGNWFSAVKKALSPDSKEKKDQKTRKPKKKWFGKSSGNSEAAEQPTLASNSIMDPGPPTEVKLSEIENEQSKQAYSVAIATAAAAEAAVVAAHAAAEVVRLTAVPKFFSNKSKEEVAAIRIQTAFRGYLARRALRALRGLVRLKSLIQGPSVKRQATATLRCMQTLARVQSQIRARRVRMLEENQALQRQLMQKTEKEIEKLKASMGEKWNDSLQSKEQIEARLVSKHEAAMRRERSLAYAFSHQTLKNTTRSPNPTFMDPNNPHWGWSWLERWMATRPWESRSNADAHDRASIKSTASNAISIGGEVTSSYHRRDRNCMNKYSSPMSQKHPNHHSPSTPLSKVPSVSSVNGKTLKGGSSSIRGGGGDEDWGSMYSTQSERYRRHSIAGSSVRDDESLASSPSVPSYMAPTQSAKAKSRLPSPLGFEKNGTFTPPDKTSVSSAKKRLSFHTPLAAGPRRHSGPPKFDTSTVKNNGLNMEAQQV